MGRRKGESDRGRDEDRRRRHAGGLEGDGSLRGLERQAFLQLGDGMLLDIFDVDPQGRSPLRRLRLPESFDSRRL